MKRLCGVHCSQAGSCLLAFLTAALLTGCTQQPKTETKATPGYFQVDPATAGKLTGVVQFTGKPPAPKRISMDAEEACEALHKTPVFDEHVVVGNDKGLANAFVYIKQGLEGKTFAPAAEAVVIDQRGCRFLPRVIGLRTGQTLTVKNSDPVSHNIHPMPQNNRDWNQQQPPQASDLQRRFARSEVMIPVKCNVHNWMRSFIGVVDHPYFAVTPASGEFALDNLPPGQYTLAAWHEAFGETTQQVTLKPGESATARFTF